MFILAILIGIYSYLFFALGLAGHLQFNYIFGLSLEFGVLCLFFVGLPKIHIKLSKLALVLLGIIVVQGIVNLAGALGPELGFDALWYHLTIPKIWLQHGRIFYIPDGRYYYSVMPKLVEMLYLPALAGGDEIWAKLIHFGFGLLTLAVIFKLARKWLSVEYSLLAVVIFYSNLVVGWQSITAYVDLGRTFFEVLAFYYLVDQKINKSALVLGLAFCTKSLALTSLPIFWIILFYQRIDLKRVILFTLLAAAVVSPWFIWAWISTGNPLYPVFSEHNFSSVRSLLDFFTVFTRSADPLNPIYFMLLPVAIYFRKKFPVTIAVYCLMGLIIWWILPRTGGGRFILPYLPVWSVLAAIVISDIQDRLAHKFMVAMAIVLAIISIGFRGVANAKFLPVIVGRQSKQDFLNRNLNHNFGDNNFYLPDPLLVK